MNTAVQILLYVVLGLFGAFALVSVIRSIRVVPAQSALVVERLGRYAKTLLAGFHVLVPFIDKVRYRHTLKEQALDVPSQPCITLDNVKVQVDGLLYMKVVDPRKASYGIADYRYATIQLAQTTMRSVIGKLELDRTFEERQQVNAAIVKSVDEASDAWGVDVTRYEIQNIHVPESVLKSMEVQMVAERDRRAALAKSVGEMESRINYSIGVMQEAINRSEGDKQARINEAEGSREEILAIAGATAAGLVDVAAAVEGAGGEDAAILRVTESFIAQLKRLAHSGTQVVLPMDLGSLSGVLDQVRGFLGAPKEGHRAT